MSSRKCPSAQPEMDGAEILGVIQGPEPRLAYLREPLPASPDVLAMAGPVSPTRVFRFAAACEEHACRHFDGAKCQLATRIVAGLAPVTDALPPCRIRTTCRWFAQEGRAACLRCPQIVTESPAPTDHLRTVALGPSPAMDQPQP